MVLTNSEYYDEKTHSVADGDNLGGAIAYFHDNRSAITEKAGLAKCEIWLIEDARCDDSNPITMRNIIRLS